MAWGPLSEKALTNSGNLGSSAATSSSTISSLLRNDNYLEQAVAVTSSGIAGLFLNGPLVAAIVAFVVAQIAKVFTHYHERQEWDWRRLVGSGGMPSSHTAFVLGLTTAIGVKEGTAAPLFALCLVFSLVVAYDACGVRLHAGRQAAVLNLIVSELPPDHPLQDSGKLHDTLGHTPVQVVMGAAVGIISGYMVQIMYGH